MNKPSKKKKTRNRNTRILSEKGLKVLKDAIRSKGVDPDVPHQVHLYIKKGKKPDAISGGKVNAILQRKGPSDYSKIVVLFETFGIFEVDIEDDFFQEPQSVQQTKASSASTVQPQKNGEWKNSTSQDSTSKDIESKTTPQSNPSQKTNTADSPIARRPFKVPYISNGFFIEPFNLLSAIGEQLAAKSRCAIFGLGGMGKTQAAAQYAYRSFETEKKYDRVFWVTADTESNLLESFNSLGSQIGIMANPDSLKQKTSIINWLESHEGWLLVFDNADNPEWLWSFFPNNLGGHVLITSRSKRFDVLEIANPLEIPLLTIDEAIDFWRIRIGRELPPQERKAAAALAKDLGYLPLAMEQAGAFLRDKNISFVTYLDRYNERLNKLKNFPAITGDFTEPEKINTEDLKRRRSVFTTWSLNFEAIKQESSAAAELLYLSSYLFPDKIPFHLITTYPQLLGGILSGSLQHENESAIDQLTFLLGIIEKYSLVKSNLYLEIYSIHRLVQDILREELAKEGKLITWLERSIDNVSRKIQTTFVIYSFEPDSELEKAKYKELIKIGKKSRISLEDTLKGQQLQLRRQLIPHAEKIIRIARRRSYESRSLSILLSDVAQEFEQQKRYNEVEPLLQQLVSIHRRTRGDFAIATTIKRLATTLFYQGNLEEAEKLFTEAHSPAKESIDDALIQSLLNADYHTFVAGIRHFQNRHDEAEKLYGEAALLYSEIWKADEVDQYDLKILSLESTDALPDAGKNLVAVANIQGLFRARIFDRNGVIVVDRECDELLPHIRLSLKLHTAFDSHELNNSTKQEILKDVFLLLEYPYLDSLSLITSNLKKEAFYYVDRGYFRKAEKVLRRVLSIQEKVLGSETQEAMSTINDLARLYNKKGDFEKTVKRIPLKILFNKPFSTSEGIEAMLLAAEAAEQLSKILLAERYFKQALTYAPARYGADALEVQHIKEKYGAFIKRHTGMNGIEIINYFSIVFLRSVFRGSRFAFIAICISMIISFATWLLEKLR